MNRSVFISKIMVILLFLSFYPVVLPGGMLTVNIFIFLFLCLICYFGLRYIKYKLFYIPVIYIILILIISLIYKGRPSFLAIPFLIYCYFLCVDEKMLKQTVFLFEKYFSNILVIGFVIYVFLIIGIELPHFKYISDDKGPLGYYYNVYLFVAQLKHQLNMDWFNRFSSIFNEPGYLGTVLGLLLIMKRMDFSDIKNKIYLVTGLFTFSGAFYVLLIYGFIVFFFKTKKVIIFSILSYALIFYILHNNETIYYYMYGRFFDGDFNNREGECFKYIFNNFLQSDNLMVGIWPNREIIQGCDVSSSNLIILYYGIVLGPIIIILNFGFIFLKYLKLENNRKYYDFILIFLLPLGLSFYQRPELFQPLQVFLLMVYIINSRNNIRRDV